MSAEVKNTITINELEKLLSNEETYQKTLNEYFEVYETGPFSWEYRLKPEIDVIHVEDSEFEGFIIKSAKTEALNSANTASRKHRDKLYDLVKDDPSRIKVVSEGDSWFQYPSFKVLGIGLTKDVKEIIDHLIEDDRFAVKSMDAGGDLIRNMYHSREYLKCLAEENPDIFLLSAGGNDFFEVFPLMLINNESDDLNKYLGRNLNTELEILGIYYISLLSEVIESFPNLQIIIHGYDYIIPREDGKWIGKPMIDIGIKDGSDRRKLIKNVVDIFNDKIRKVASQFPNNVHYLNLRNTVPLGTENWHDEIHPNSESFELISNEFKNLMLQIYHS